MPEMSETEPRETGARATDLLREAARLMTERAEAATPGPWEADTSEVYGACHEWVGETMVLGNDNLTATNSVHISSWHPGVARKVAKWLQEEANAETIWPHEPTAALAVAREYLGADREPAQAAHGPGLAAAVADVCRRMEGSGVFEAGVWARVLRQTLAEFEGSP